jgi:enoyl-CoA hydratase
VELQERYPSLGFAWPRPGVLEITFKGERLNAMDPKTHRALSRVWRDLEEVEEARAVLIRARAGSSRPGAPLPS